MSHPVCFRLVSPHLFLYPYASCELETGRLPFTIAVLLRYNRSRTTKFTLSKHVVRWILVYSQSGMTMLTALRLQNTISLLKGALNLPADTPILPSPQPPATTSLLSVSLDLPCLYISYERNHKLCGFCDWLLLLSIILPRSVHVTACMGTAWLLMANSCSTA